MDYKVVDKTYVKSKNSVKNIYKHYTYSLVALICLMIISYLIFGYQELILPLFKSLSISFLITTIISYIINLIKKNNYFLDIYIKDNAHLIALIIGLFGVNTNILVLFTAIFISLVIKKSFKSINLSASLYGILLILIYKYYNFDSTLITNLNINEISKANVLAYIIGTNYISPLFSIISFIYLFYKKSIKYNIFIPFILTFTFIMFIYGIFNDMIWFGIIQLLTSNIIFLSVYTLNDYSITPTIAEGQILYGLLLGVISSVVQFIVPNISIVIVFILAPILLTKLFDNISPKLKYSKKLYNFSIISIIILAIITIVLLTVMY